MAVDTGVIETSVPLGSFKAKTATTQISSRRTLSTAVPIEKVSQKTKYQVFNTEVEINGNLLLEEVNNDVANLFTIYTSEEKQDPTTLVDNFKDKSSITLVDATKEWIFKREPESEDIQIATTKFIHDTTELLILKHNEVEVGVGLKVGTITFADNTTLTTSADLTGLLNDINTTNPSYTEFAKNIKLPNGDIISSVYDDTDVRSVLSSSAGTGITWNATNNQFDNSITQYTDADARSAVYPITQTNSGLPVVNGGMELFDNNVWYNTTEGRNRFYFTTDGTTTIRAPDLTSSSVSLQIGVNDIFKSEIDKNTSYKNLHIGNGLATTPTLFLDGANGQSVSSQIIFGDAGTSTTTGTYKQGMSIFYDSSANYLRISGDQNTDSVLDTPYFLNINRSNGDVSIGDNTSELGFKLKVGGNVIVKSAVGNNIYDSQVCFGDEYWLTGVVSDGNYYYNQVQGWWNNGNNRGFRLYNRSNNTVPFIVNSNGNVGISNTAPAHRLDVNGDIHTTTTIRTPKIDFDDGTAMTSAPFTPSYFKIFLTGTLPDNFTETKQSYFNGTNSLNVGSYTYTANEITIPADGVYEIMYNIHIRTTSGSDRQTPITHIRINDAYADGVRQGIWGSYVRYRSGTSANNREVAGTGQTMLSLSSGDKVSIWAVREGNAGTASIQAGSQINIKRIG